MVDVALEAGVSQKTVSRVLNDSPQVRPEVRERVLAAVESLGYRRNGAARALAAGRSHVIGIVATESPLFGIAQHVMGLEREARARGYGTVVVSTSEDGADSDVRAAVERALELGAEGVVVVEPFWRHTTDFASLADVPLVIPHHAAPTHRLHRHVAPAERDGAHLATQHLLDLGHRRTAHIGGPLTWDASLIREQGWRETLEAAGAPPGEVVRGDWSPRSGYLAAQQLLSSADRPTAVFAANDSMAIGAVRAFAEAGLRVPDDVAVVGFDDIPEAEFQAVPLTTVRQDFATIARRAVEHVVHALDAQPPHDEPAPPARLVVRASTGPPRTEVTPLP